MFVSGVSSESIPKEYRRKYIVHHKEHLTADNIGNDKIAYDFNNLELLCIDCHNAEHKATNGAVKDGYKFDGDGMLIKC